MSMPIKIGSVRPLTSIKVIQAYPRIRTAYIARPASSRQTQLAQSSSMQSGYSTMTSQSKDKALTARCQCGNVTFLTPAVQPSGLFHCHCTECQKQSASAYGTSAVYPAEGLFPLSQELTSKLKVFTRPTNNGGSMDCYFCPDCGSRMFHRIVSKDGTPRSTVSLKAGCIEGLDWKGGKHIYVRSAVIKIPKDWEQYDTVPPQMRQK